MYIYNCIYIYTHIYIHRERAAYHGGGVVKGLIYKVLHHYAWVGVVMRCYEMVKQNISKHNVILQEMCFHQWFWCLQWILHYIVVYITIYIYTPLIDLFDFFTIVYVSRYIYDIEQTCILSCCSWVLFTKEPVQIEHALLQKDSLTTIESRPFPGIIYILP